MGGGIRKQSVTIERQEVSERGGTSGGLLGGEGKDQCRKKREPWSCSTCEVNWYREMGRGREGGREGGEEGGERRGGGEGERAEGGREEGAR